MASDFDFIVGKWRVKNRRLKKRLCQCDEWISFDADFESRHILFGLGNIDEIKIESPQFNFCGLSVRMYNPSTKEWTIYWADSHHPEIGLKPQVVGTFNKNIGTFIGSEEFEGNEVKLRFIWKSIKPDHAYWEQAYFDNNRNEWEVNWTMDFYKKQESD